LSEGGLSDAEPKADPCCTPEAQATCCAPTEKDECCAASHGEGCGCAAALKRRGPDRDERI
jgi:hypothetical protein